MVEIKGDIISIRSLQRVFLTKTFYDFQIHSIFQSHPFQSLNFRLIFFSPQLLISRMIAKNRQISTLYKLNSKIATKSGYQSLGIEYSYLSIYSNKYSLLIIKSKSIMGQNNTKDYALKQKVISVISLNYSGILLSPFEFFSKETPFMSEIQSSLSNIYKSLLKNYHPEFSQNKKENKFKWNLGKIDQKMQEERYSPLYNKGAGVNFKNLVSEQEFKKKWTIEFDRNIEIIMKRDPTFKFTQQEKNQALQFDLLCYKCIVSYVYKKDFSELAHKLQTLNVKYYNEFMEFMFSKSFLNEQKKLEKTLKAMQREKIDIVFAQQANQNLIKKIQSIPEYAVYKREGCESIIVVKKEKFHNFYNSKGKYPLSQLPELEKELNWNNDTMVAFVDNLILISGHLSSKKEKNPQQVFEMVTSLKKLHAIYPMCHIIVGADANSFVPQTYADYVKEKGEEIEKKDAKLELYMYPQKQASFTTSKQRTYLQPQVSKAEEIARVCRDHLIILKAQDIEIKEAKVCTINNRAPSEVENLPCEEHPYDHYVVKGEIKVNVMTHFGHNYDGDKY